jgi:dihydrofolate reductase
MIQERKIILFIAMSLDGYIASHDDDLGFLSMVEKDGEDYGYHDFASAIDTVIMGRKTFDKVISMGFGNPHLDKELLVITRNSRPTLSNEKYYTGSLTDLIRSLKAKDGKHIYCDGGAEIVHELLKNKLLDEMIISIIPILLGDGVRLFKDKRPEQKMVLVQATPYDTGLIQLHYIYVV